MNKITKKTLSIILAILMIVTMVPFALAAEGCTQHSYAWTENPASNGALGTCSICSGKIITINLSDNDKLRIAENGYNLDGSYSVYVPFNGTYVISGKTKGNVSFDTGTYDVIFHDVIVENASWAKGLELNSATVNAVAYGVNRFVGYNHAGLSGGNGVLNLTVGENSSVYFAASYNGTEYSSVNPETTLNVISGTPDADMSGEDWYYGALTVSNGTPAAHTYTKEIDDDNCKVSCCGFYFYVTHQGTATCSTSGTCINCGKTYLNENNHEEWNDGVCKCGESCGHTDYDTDGFCEICGSFIGKEIKLNETIEIDVPSSGVYVKFVPAESVKYLLKSNGASSTYLNLKDENLSSIGSHYPDENIAFTFEYEGGKTYYFNIRTYNAPAKFEISLLPECVNHTGGTQTCQGYLCENCENWYGEADETKHNWQENYGYCINCNQICEHPSFDNGICTVCTYSMSFSLKTGENVTYHDSFADALDKAEDGSTIKLLTDYGDYNGLEINKAITLDLNGKTWDQPSSASHSVNSNVTFTDSVGGGYLYYGLYLNSPCTFSGGAYRYIGINFETEDALDDYLAICCDYYDYNSGELLDLTEEKAYRNIKIAENHSGGTATCMGYKCELCGEWYGEIDADNHSYTKYVSDYNATCTSDGTKTAECDNGCGESDTVADTGSALGHTPSGWWAKNEAEHWRHCVNDSCSEEIEGTRAEHSYAWEVTVEATATADGEKVGTCECGATKTEIIPATGTPSDGGDCDHICHNDFFLAKLIWKILNFFFKLFDVQQYCDCGITHY